MHNILNLSFEESYGYMTLHGSQRIMLKTNPISLKNRFSKLLRFLKSDLTWTATVFPPSSLPPSLPPSLPSFMVGTDNVRSTLLSF